MPHSISHFKDQFHYLCVSQYIEVASDTITDYEAFDAGFHLDTYQIPLEFEEGGITANCIPIDFSHDGFMDMIVTQAWPAPSADEHMVRALAYVNDGTGHFTEVTSQVLGELRIWGFCHWQIADFDGDGYDDVFLADGGTDYPPWDRYRHILLIGRPDGTLVDEGPDRVPAPRGNPYWGDAGDIDNDGDIDILTTNGGGEYNVLLNDGTGHFTYPPYGVGPTDFGANNGMLIDFDHDGDLDMFFATSDNQGEEDVILINDGTGHFSHAPAGTLAPRFGEEGGWTGGYSLSGDLNGDGWTDILVGLENQTLPTYRVQNQLQLNNGDGTYQDATSRFWNNGAFSMGWNRNHIADFNGDGWLDLLIGGERLHINHGGNWFEDVSDGFFPGHPFTDLGQAAAVDLDNDGDTDIIGNYPALHQVFVYVNELPYSIPEAPLPYPEAPYLQSPINGTTLSTIEAPLAWASVTGAVTYKLQVALDPVFSQKVRDLNGLTGTEFLIRGLTGSTDYYWRVCAVNSRGQSSWSEIWAFTTPPTVIISGSITCQGEPFQGARMLNLPGQPVTDANGHYETQVQAGWSGTVTPYKADYNFIPETMTYANVVAAQATDYVAYIGIPYHERQALLAFYNSTGGDSWTNRSGWKEPPLETDGFAAYGTEGTWYGVTVDITRPPEMHPVTVKVINLSNNNLSGTLPANLGNLTNLISLTVNGAVGGSLPASMVSLLKLQVLSVSESNLEGSIPAWLGSMPVLNVLELSRNRLSGTIPPGLGNCKSLSSFSISLNAVVGPIPSEFTNLTNLSGGSIACNALFATDPAVEAFLDARLPGWEEGQVRAPINVAAAAQSETSILVSWTYALYSNGYHVSYSTSPGGPYEHCGTWTSGPPELLVSGLSPGTTYYFIVQNFMNPNGINKNIVTSAYSAEASATTSTVVTLAVTSPNGGQSWAAGSSHPVTWTSGGISGDITVELYKGGAFNSTIGIADVSAETFSWNIPSGQAAGTDYRVRISQGAVEDFSDSNFTITSGAAVWTASQRLTWNSGSSARPTAAVDASGNLHLVWSDNSPGNYEIYYKKSTGTGWATAKRLTSTSGPSQCPTIAVSSSGALHAVYWDETGGNAEVYYLRSTDGGTTWAAARRLTWTAGPSNYPSLAVDSSGAVHAVWQDNTPGSYEIYYRKSADGGATWGMATRLTWNLGSSTRPAIAVNASGHIHLVWQDDTPGKAEIYSKKSTDGGTTWTANKRLTWTSGASTSPSLSIDSSGNLHVAWQDDTPGNNEIYYSRSTDGGSSWTTAKRLTWTTGTSQEPSLGIDSSGKIELVWAEDVSGNFEVYHKESTDGGVTWSTTKNLSATSGISNSPVIKAGSSGSLHVFWSDGTPGNAEIYYRRRQQP
jgi:hypothetical protein